MYSHALVGYQNSSLQFWEKSSKTMSAVADSFKGYQYYEFTTLKELTETSKKLAEDTSSCDDIRKIFDDNDEDEDKDRLIFFEADYRDDDSSKAGNKENKKSKLFGKKPSTLGANKAKSANPKRASSDSKANNSLLDLNFDSKEDKSLKQTSNATEAQQNQDILTLSDGKTDDLSLLNEILNAPTAPVIAASGGGVGATGGGASNAGGVDLFMPSQLIDLNSFNYSSNPMKASMNPMTTRKEKLEEMNKKVNLNANKDKAKKTEELSSWFNLFADLDPLANPDAIGKKADQIEDRNC
ncbi:unnamed protein product [Oppiella nova]|uniref:Islet cell autoantigen Ica1 C-terminal domain-containing protein n=1 Tax=Oppiella nova TaxID=334625 RepID=A0A7R9MM24_9ACAR|nr:unnamed protein product [Oppiella nova]CAG2179488.1 unnamed protein product [Oppiella nova]